MMPRISMGEYNLQLFELLCNDRTKPKLTRTNGKRTGPDSRLPT